MRLALESFIDPELAAHVEDCRNFYAARIPGRGPSSAAELHEARTRRRPEIPPGARAVERLVEHAGVTVPVRIFTPEHGTARGVYVDIHGGGFYLGSAADGDARNRQLADALHIVVVSVDYRLAPEHPWPAAPDDCEATALWLLNRAEAEFGTSRVAIGGASAGATLAMTTVLRLRERAVTAAVAGVVLQFGTYDLSGQTPAGRLIKDEYFIEAYAGSATDRTRPDISPVYAELGGLPPTLFVIGRSDVLLEDNLAMAARLSAAGNAVDLRVYPECPHGFTSHPTAMAYRAHCDIQTWLADRF